MRGRALVLLIGLTVVGCAGDPHAQGRNPLTLTRLRATPSAFALVSDFEERQRLVVRTPAQWQSVWNAIWPSASQRPALPKIDFDREVVIVAAMGSRPSGGYNIVLDSVSESGNDVNVVVRSISPGPACIVTQILTQPVDIARMTRHDGNITFTERNEVADCR